MNPHVDPVIPMLAYMHAHHAGGECGVPYAMRYRMPDQAGDPQADAPWYSFDYGEFPSV